ncbi:phage tail sheath subtilisin-like domain-containing protein [Pantoea sp. Bo_2]
MVAAYRATDPFGELYVIAVDDDKQGTNATGTVSISGTANAAGTISVYIGTNRVQAVISADDTPIQSAQALADAINAKADLPVTATVKAASVSVDGVSVSGGSSSLAVGDKTTLTANVSPNNATNKTVTWTVNDSSLATLAPSGSNNESCEVTAVKAGTVKVTVTTQDGNKTADKSIVISAQSVAVTGVTLDKTTLSVAVGASSDPLAATIAPATATNKAVTWASDDETIATVVDGVVTGVKAGAANITVTTKDGKKTATCAATVTAQVKSASGVKSGVTTAVVTLTAKYAGKAGNAIPLTLNYYGTVGGEETPDGLTIIIDGMKGGEASLTPDDAIAAMGDEAFDFIGLALNDSASLATMDAEMNDSSGRWSWARQLYGHVYTARTGTLSELVEFGDSFNKQHLTICGYEVATQTPYDELIGYRLGRQAVFLRNDPARPTQTGELTGALPAPVGSRFTLTEQQSLLTHGIATASVTSGALLIQRDITTYKKNKYGVSDNSYLDSETLHTSAYVIRKLKSAITSKYPRHKLADDGTRYGAGQAIVTPAVLKGEICAVYRQLETAGIVENFDTFKSNLKVVRNANNVNRVDVLFPPDYVNQLRVFALLNQFRLQYSDEEMAANA